MGRFPLPERQARLLDCGARELLLEKMTLFCREDLQPGPALEGTDDRRSRESGPKVWLLRLFVVLGFAALFFYFSWWMVNGRYQNPLLLLSLVLAVIYAGMQMVSNWLLYLWARQPDQVQRWPEGLTVDVFVTAYQEPPHMVARTLAAACALHGEHHTWLLDDGNDPALEAMANRLGAGYLTRSDHRDAKAGNVNAALARTAGDIIAIFDVDHVPEPDFLERSSGLFADPEVGFVQVMLTFSNGEESWVAQAAIETSLEFYNPTSLGADNIGGATLMGSNALIRRKALESIAGYQPGLAEDLATSIQLHAAGWKSAYVAEPLAPGIAPPSFTAWFVQQLKWARGVFELLITTYPRVFQQLTWGQRLAYSVRMTKYWIGPAVALHLFATIAILIFTGPGVRGAFHEYLVKITPLVLADVLIRHMAFRLYRHHTIARTSLARAVALVYGTWPIYLLAWSMALLRLPLSFRTTPKSQEGKQNPLWLLPQVIVLVLLLAGTIYAIVVEGHPVSALLGFAILQGLVQLLFLARWLYASEASSSVAERINPFEPAAVLDVDLDHFPDQIEGLEYFSQALALVRINGRPAGQIGLKVESGSIDAARLKRAIFESADLVFWQAWLEDYLNWQPFAEGNPAHKTATIAICTRDRPEDLRRCLESLARLPDDGQEILVVDSCSIGEATRVVAESFSNVRYVREEIPGLNRARNRAFFEAAHEIVAFTDDDAVVDSGWLRAIVCNFNQPGVLSVTGLTMPLELNTKAQQWFERYNPFNRGFQRKVYDKKVLYPLAAGLAGAGVSMAFRRDLLRQVGPFDEALDAGTPTQSGGDTEMFSRILASGFQIIYDPAALSWHRHRRTWEELQKTIYGYGVGTYAYWTRKFLVEGEWGVVLIAGQWAVKFQIPELIRSLIHLSNSTPADLVIAEVRGCLAGPSAYLKSKRDIERIQDHGKNVFLSAQSEHHYSHP
jgi:cellulose synthase/poly-beta-1,6-N-acetylglucosamine synthase-like glycosyltransferase